MKIQQKRFFWTLSPLALGFLFTCFALLIDAKGNKTVVTVSLPKISEQEVVDASCAFWASRGYGFAHLRLAAAATSGQGTAVCT